MDSLVPMLYQTGATVSRRLETGGEQSQREGQSAAAQGLHPLGLLEPRAASPSGHLEAWGLLWGTCKHRDPYHQRERGTSYLSPYSQCLLKAQHILLFLLLHELNRMNQF